MSRILVASALSACILALLMADKSGAELQTKTITYKHGDTECRGYLAWDDAIEGKRPGVLVLHEWWGLNDYARQRTRQLAELGYIAFAADIYGEGKTVEHPQDAGKMATEVRSNVSDWRQRAQAALKVLTSQPQCDTSKLAAIGYCFGGSTALQLAYAGADLDAVVTFHAALPAATVEEAKRIKPEILVCHGADDPFVGADAVKAFQDALKQADVNVELVAYDGARHSFTVPDADEHGIDGIKYDRNADEQSWKAMRELFAERLAQ